jgi:predicted acetyltransferase
MRKGRAGTCHNLTVFELVADTPAARESFVPFMAIFDPVMFEVCYSTPRGEHLHPFPTELLRRGPVSPEFMLRLVNVEGALGLLQRRSEAPLALEVADEIQENAGSYAVGGSNGHAARAARAGSGRR